MGGSIPIPTLRHLLWLPSPALPHNPGMRFRVQLDTFAGPLDLLLYLVRRHELDVLDIPIARVADQYLEILAVHRADRRRRRRRFSRAGHAAHGAQVADDAAAAGRGRGRRRSKTRGRTWSPGCWSTSGTRTRRRCWRTATRVAAPLRAARRTTSTTARPTRPASRFRRSSCGTSSARSAA